MGDPSPFCPKREPPLCFSPELNLLLSGSLDLEHLVKEEVIMVSKFQKAGATLWREGSVKSSFNYLLLDPFVTMNLPLRAKVLGHYEAFRIFLTSVFYIGKGKRSRPYSHLHEAVPYMSSSTKSAKDNTDIAFFINEVREAMRRVKAANERKSPDDIVVKSAVETEYNLCSPLHETAPSMFSKTSSTSHIPTEATLETRLAERTAPPLKSSTSKAVSPKVQQILNIWQSGLGVVSLHCFQNAIPVEAYTREACMVDAMGLKHLTNRRRGEYYGVASSWPGPRRRAVGALLLWKAFQIFLCEGERHICPQDLRRRKKFVRGKDVGAW